MLHAYSVNPVAWPGMLSVQVFSKITKQAVKKSLDKWTCPKCIMVDFETDDKVLAKPFTKQDKVKAELIQKIKTEEQNLGNSIKKHVNQI